MTTGESPNKNRVPWDGADGKPFPEDRRIIFTGEGQRPFHARLDLLAANYVRRLAAAERFDGAP